MKIKRHTEGNKPYGRRSVSLHFNHFKNHGSFQQDFFFFLHVNVSVKNTRLIGEKCDMIQFRDYLEPIVCSVQTKVASCTI